MLSINASRLFKLLAQELPDHAADIYYIPETGI
jgi:hypothetical protein